MGAGRAKTAGQVGPAPSPKAPAGRVQADGSTWTGSRQVPCMAPEDERNLPELGILERAKTSVPQLQTFITPLSPETQTHVITGSMAKLYVPALAAFLAKGSHLLGSVRISTFT